MLHCGTIHPTEPATRGKPARSDQPILEEGNLAGARETVSGPWLVILFPHNQLSTGLAFACAF